MKGFMNKGMAVMLTMALVSGTIGTDFGSDNAKADIANQEVNIGSLADKVTGTWSYWDGTKDVVQTNAMLLEKLPTLANKDVIRWTTDNYDNNTGAIDIGDFGTSFMWNYSSNAYGNSVYAIPMSYKATAGGMFVTKPSTIRIDTTFIMQQPEDGSLTDFVIWSDSVFANSKVDKVTGWSYDVVMEDRDDASKYMKAIITQGSPFSFYEYTGTDVAQITRKRTSLPSKIVAYDGSSVADSTMLVFRVYDNQDLVTGYSSYDYYAVYVPKGAQILQSGTDATNGIGTIKIKFPSEEKSYLSFAWLCETMDEEDAAARAIAEKYKAYAYNFITDTSVTYSYHENTGEVKTQYNYEVERKEESTAEGTVMGILPHQYKHMDGYTYLENTARTIRGDMKYLEGSSYETILSYSGILPSMMEIDPIDREVLQGYVDDFMEEYGPTDTELTKESYSVNTYDTGKKLNRAVQVMEAAEACGDTESAAQILSAIERELADWFTYTGEEDEKYFYYCEEVGSLFGFPQAYYTVDGMTDHHFHYGYFINACAQVALRDKSFIPKYKNVIDEMIGDIATAEKTSSDSKYPYLRYFSTWEGHSWASGHANFADGNNQESSSEAVNAWAGLILYGEATQDKELTELGIYLYQTEISSVNCYWFDVEEDILDSAYKQVSDGDTTLPKYSQASMVWGGKYTYAAWWTAEPLQIQGINILPMTSASFYYAANTDFILKNWKTALINEENFTGDDKEVNRWNEIWSSYLAIADSEKAEEYFNPDCAPEAGESKAHCYHYIKSLEKAGTPDLSVTSNTPLSSAFQDRDGNMTYVVYNASGTDKEVVFSDGTIVTAKAGAMTTVTDGEVAQKARYTVEHYLQNQDGSYTLFSQEVKTGKIGSEAMITVKSFAGYTYNPEVEGSIKEGEIREDGSLVLKLYYDISEIKTTQPSENPSLYTSLGSYEGYSISYYMPKDDIGVAVKLLDANATFYVEYNGMFGKDNTTGYLNQSVTPDNVYTGVYKTQTSVLNKDAYNTVKIQSGNKVTYIVIKVGEPVSPPDMSDLEIETQTSNPKLPTEASGLVVGSISENTIVVTFRETQEQKEKGQTYNIYIDNKKVLSNVATGTYSIHNVSGGKRTVKVTAVLENKESSGISDTVKVNGEIFEEPTKPELTSPDETESVTAEAATTEAATTEEATSAETTVRETIVSAETTNQGAGAPVETNKSGTVVPAEETKKISEGSITQQKAVKAKIIKAAKKFGTQKVKISVRKIQGAQKYQIQFSKTKKFTKKTIRIVRMSKKTTFIVKSKKLKNKKKLYVRVRAVKVVNGKNYYGKWSKKKKVTIKK